MENVTENAPQSEEVTASTIPQVEEENVSLESAFNAFGLEAPKKEESQNSEEKADPPTDQPITDEKKGITVKFNKEETFIEEDKIPEYARKGLNYDKVETRANEYQKALDEVAQLQGFKDHADLIANLPKLREQQQQQEQDAHSQLIADLRQQAEDAGLDPDQVQSYLDNHPLVKEAQKAIQEREAERLEREEQASKAEARRKWDTLYEKYPDLIESSRAFDEGKAPDWFNAEMQSRIQRGYDPLDAYELANRDKITAQTRRATEQKVIKQQQLGLRSQVETVPSPDDEPQVPPALAAAFAAFDLPVSAAQKYVKKAR